MQSPPKINCSTMSSAYGVSSMLPGVSTTMISTATATTDVTDRITAMVPPAKDADPSTVIDFVHNQLDRIGTEVEVLDGLKLLGGGLNQRMQGGMPLPLPAASSVAQFLMCTRCEPARQSVEL
jgi:hypothetical protein